MTAEQNVKREYPESVCRGTPRIIYADSGPASAALSEAVLMFRYSDKHAWADAWRRIQREKKEAQRG